MQLSLEIAMKLTERKLLAILALTALLGLSGACRRTAETVVAWPEISSETRPWGRWWWMGSSVNKDDITALLKEYREAGLGGMEITPIYGVKGYEKQFIPYLSGNWMEMLDHTLEEAEKLGMGIDMATGTGWPFGGPWVSGEDASRYVIPRVYQLNEGERLQEPVSCLQDAFVRSAAAPLDIHRLRQPVSANEHLQALAIDQVRFEKALPLIALVAYSESGASIDLTTKVDARGELDWAAPSGKWTLYALFQGWHGKMVERAAPGGEGLVIDHFSENAVKDYLKVFDSAFAGHDVSSLRAFFNDSYEVDDARGDADWTPSLLEEFEKRRGYDLRTQLPALFGEATPENHRRVLCDYRETISELLLEKFTDGWKSWANGQRAVVRNQAHGSPANILDLYAASDIPETEGNDIMRFKFASSAANVTGKQLISSESATWLNEHFLSSLSDVKAAVDKFFIGGVNHIFYHGVNYSPRAEDWPGWLFYAAVHFSPSNPFWDDFAALNRYVARCQSFLQKGRPDNDILLYFPVYDRFSTPVKGSMLAHFDGMEGWEGSDLDTVSRQMLTRGYAFDLISDLQLQKVEYSGGQLQTGSRQQTERQAETEGNFRSGRNSYSVIVLPRSRFIPLKTFEKLLELVRDGATVIAHDRLPDDVPGLARLSERSERYHALITSLEFQDAGAAGAGIKEAAVGKGRVLTGNNLETLLRYAGVRREVLADKGLQFVRRSYENGNYYFLLNSGQTPVDGWVPLSASGPARSGGTAAVFNPMNKQYGLAGFRRNKDGQTEVYLQLAPGESCIVQTFNGTLSGPPYRYYRPAGEAAEITGTWKIDFVRGGPELPQSRETAHLGSWTSLEGKDVKRFSGTATYTISFPRPQAGSRAWILDLGEVYHSARVRLNGKIPDTLIGPRYRLLLDSTELSEDNLLEISVSNLMGNRISWMDRQKIPWKKFYNVNFSARLPENRGEDGLFDASNWKPLPSGLAGPVTLQPVKFFEPGAFPAGQE